MQENEIVLKLELTVGETNVVLASLGKHPFDEISNLILKIRSQGETQLKELNALKEGKNEQ
jgi:hypothetical protein